MSGSVVQKIMLEVTAPPGWSLHVHGDKIESFRVVPVDGTEPQEDRLAIPSQEDYFDRVISDAEKERRIMPWLFGKRATELSKKELLAFTIILAGPVNSYGSK